MTHHVNYMHWPFLSQEEFELACSSLNQRYIQAKQKSNSLTFKLTHRYIAASGSSYIQIIRLLQPALDVTGLSNALAKLEFFEYGSFECDNNVDYLSEEYDKVFCALILHYFESHQILIKYSRRRYVYLTFHQNIVIFLVSHM